MIDVKSPKRHRATAKEWAEIRDHLADESCWVCGGKWTELHHILNRSHSGDDLTVNLAPLCAVCHRDVEARDPYARSQIRSALMPSNFGYLRYRLGDFEQVEAWLDRNYARAKEAA